MVIRHLYQVPYWYKFPHHFSGDCDRTCSISEETECNTGNNHYRTGQLVCVVVGLLSLLSAVASAAIYEEVEEARLAFVSHLLDTSLGLKSMGQPG